MNLILFGAPGAGKGTQAERISGRLGIPVIGTGALIREAIAAETPVGRRIKPLIDAGALVPDDVVIEMLRERLGAEDCRNGYILDGFPRNLAQAEALDAMDVSVDLVLDIEVEDSKIERRLAGRRVCERCGSTYHVEFNPPKHENVCDNCTGPLTTRSDDRPETVMERLRVYHKQSEPLRDYYAKTGKLRVVQGQEELSATCALIDEVLEEFR